MYQLKGAVKLSVFAALFSDTRSPAGKYFFRLDNELQIMGSHAFEIGRLFGGFPTVSNNGAEVRVDAVYENKRGEINFFIGRVCQFSCPSSSTRRQLIA